MAKNQQPLFQVRSSPDIRTKPPGRERTDRVLAWKTKDGDMMRVCDMADQHLENCIKLLTKTIAIEKLRTGETSMSVMSLKYMEDELSERKTNTSNE